MLRDVWLLRTLSFAWRSFCLPLGNGLNASLTFQLAISHLLGAQSKFQISKIGIAWKGDVYVPHLSPLVALLSDVDQTDPKKSEVIQYLSLSV